jgi:hypothetical protein
MCGCALRRPHAPLLDSLRVGRGRKAVARSEQSYYSCLTMSHGLYAIMAADESGVVHGQHACCILITGCIHSCSEFPSLFFDRTFRWRRARSRLACLHAAAS